MGFSTLIHAAACELNPGAWEHFQRNMVKVLEGLGLAEADEHGRRSVARSAVTQARQRLGLAPMEDLFGRCSRAWGGEPGPMPGVA